VGSVEAYVQSLLRPCVRAVEPQGRYHPTATSADLLTYPDVPMHKGRVYELWPPYRFLGPNHTYPYWPPASITVTTATWAGTEAASVPTAPLLLQPTGLTPTLRARYECPLFDHGGGHTATLCVDFYVFDLWKTGMRIAGDWGVDGSLPDVPQYNRQPGFASFDSLFNSTGTPAEAYLRPTRLVWEATPY